MRYKLSPSDFAYLYEECKLCYCLKIKYGIYQPSMPMPGVFSAINTRVQGKLVGQNLGVLGNNLPDCDIIEQEGFVESKEIADTHVFIKGKFDLLARNKDGTYTIIDLKISQADESKIEKYKTQLGAYKFAFENPKDGKAIKVSRLGLLIFYPDSVSFERGTAMVDFPPKWLDVPMDDEGFTKFAQLVDKLLSGPMPEESKTCKWCQYRHVGEKLSHEKGEPVSIRGSLVEEFGFGKYKGLKVSEVFRNDPDYLKWLLGKKIEARESDGKNDVDWIFTLEHYLS